MCALYPFTSIPLSISATLCLLYHISHASLGKTTDGVPQLLYDISHASLGKTTDGVPQRGDQQTELIIFLISHPLF